MKWIDFLVDFILVLIVAIVIISVFPQVIDLSKQATNYTDLTYTQQNAITGSFNSFTIKLEQCLNNGKEKCRCVNVIPDYPLVFDSKVKKSVTFEIIPNKDLTNFSVNLVFNDREPIASKFLNGQVYAFDGKNEETFRQKFWLIRIGPSANLQANKMKISFAGSKPEFIVVNADYSNPSETISSANVYKFSKNKVAFLTGESSAPLC